MNKFIYLFFCTLSALYGCADSIPTGQTEGSVAVSLTVRPAAAELVTRTTDEDGISDVNMLLYNASGKLTYRCYSQSSTLRFETAPGRYLLFLAANLHRELDDMSLAEIKKFAVPYGSDRTDLPMSAMREIEVVKDSSRAVELPAVAVHRAVAKVAYNITVDEAAGNLTLTSVRVYNIPRQCRLFDSRPWETASDFTSGPFIGLEDGAKACSGQLYLPENRQGSVPSVQSPRQRNRDNAPSHATYLLIRAQRDRRVLDYTVYLGENATDNFDVNRNTFQTYDIIVKGDNEVDTRVHGYTVTVSDDMEDSGMNGYCTVDSLRSIRVDIEGNSRNMRLFAELEITEGIGESFRFDGRAPGGYHEFELTQGRNTYRAAYLPSVVSDAKSVLRYGVTVYDEFGASRYCELEHRYANEVRVQLASEALQKSGGSVTVSGELCFENNAGNLRVLCSEKGCILAAKPADGYRFAGWFRDAA